VIRHASEFLRDDPARQQYAGIGTDRVAHTLAELLDELGRSIATLDDGVRWQAVQSCRVLLGEPMASPRNRRTRPQGLGVVDPAVM
jgi:hypothetical protein